MQFNFLCHTNLVPRVRDPFGLRQGSRQDERSPLTKAIAGSVTQAELIYQNEKHHG